MAAGPLPCKFRSQCAAGGQARHGACGVVASLFISVSLVLTPSRGTGGSALPGLVLEEGPKQSRQMETSLLCVLDLWHCAVCAVFFFFIIILLFLNMS